MRYLVLALKGAAYGITHIVPGLGGGFILILLGIYEEFVEAVGNLVTDRARWREYIPFLGSLGVGMVASMVVFSSLINTLLTRYPAASMFFFMGLMVGTIPPVLKMHEDMRSSLGRGAALLLGLLAVVALRLAKPESAGSGLGIDINSPGGMLYNGATSFVAGGASVTPGLDGTYILLLAGTYEPFTGALKQLASLVIRWTALLPTGLGAVLGILTFSKLIDTAIKRAPATSYYCILGLVAGSVYGLWPHEAARVAPLWIAVAFVAGLLLALVFGKPAEGKQMHAPGKE